MAHKSLLALERLRSLKPFHLLLVVLYASGNWWVASNVAGGLRSGLVSVFFFFFFLSLAFLRYTWADLTPIHTTLRACSECMWGSLCASVWRRETNLYVWNTNMQGCLLYRCVFIGCTHVCLGPMCECVGSYVRFYVRVCAWECLFEQLYSTGIFILDLASTFYFHFLCEH